MLKEKDIERFKECLEEAEQLAKPFIEHSNETRKNIKDEVPLTLYLMEEHIWKLAVKLFLHKLGYSSL